MLPFFVWFFFPYKGEITTLSAFQNSYKNKTLLIKHLVQCLACSQYLHLATWGFRKVRPSRCTSFTPSFRSKVWLLSGSLQLSRHWRTVAAANTEHPAQFAGKVCVISQTHQPHLTCSTSKPDTSRAPPPSQREGPHQRCAP